MSHHELAQILLIAVPVVVVVGMNCILAALGESGTLLFPRPDLG